MEPLQLLERYYGYSSFRPGQETIIRKILAGHNTFAVMPTGGGKSICYQIPALMMEGLTLVVSPLISLMKDQVDHLNQLGIPAAYINSTLSSEEMEQVLRDAARRAYKLLYVAPERLESPRFQSILRGIPLSLVTIDEAHCISQWGHDFRTSYRSLARWIGELPQRPVIAAFTATATREVREDIARLLSFEPEHIFTMGLERKNLSFSVLHGEDTRGFAAGYLKENPGRPGIFYCATRKETERLHQFLTERGFSVGRYHGGLSETERKQAQEDFAFDRVQAIVATNAFGMGIDKSNVRFVIHCQMPRNLESYYQEAGRAGRDGEESECILLFSPSDVQTQKFLIDQSELPPELKAQEHAKLREMYGYAHTQQCLQQTFVRYFGEKMTEPCGKCGNCTDAGERTDVTVEAQKIFSCVRRMRERFGISLTAKVLKGSKSKRVLELGFDSLPTYGLLKEYTEKEITHRIRVLAAEGYLQFTNEEYPVLTLTPDAAAVLKGEKRVLLRVKKRRKQTASIRDDLYERLRSLRKELSEAEQVPPYMIFPDSTLADLTRILPVEPESMRSVRGVGDRKLEKYGTRFLEVIREYAEEKGLSPNHAAKEAAAALDTPAGGKDKEPSHLITWRLWNDGMDLDAIAKERGLSPATLDGHLFRAAGEGYPVDWDRLIPEGQEPLIRQAVEEVGGTRLKPIKETLPDHVSYTAIKAVLAKQSGRGRSWGQKEDEMKSKR
ncbi:RecQ-like ATP-dependent DNA helicase [Melghirimyces profundicolus]|uniref:DNA helicase RecQ n=1 Tax=Melghirimyces profundicolus TaxID=1242148 RepID=A0A2T6BSQ5_9BACL|nr:DNA helicase RecQ [Melghirimyces profundicolus]PTX59103.1 RecQ-like ATP-dependent DNA helicase [Melghirimyces profundicolus]